MTLGRRAPVLVVALLMWSGVAVERVLFAQQAPAAAVIGSFYCPMHGEITGGIRCSTNSSRMARPHARASR